MFTPPKKYHGKLNFQTAIEPSKAIQPSKLIEEEPCGCGQVPSTDAGWPCWIQMVKKGNFLMHGIDVMIDEAIDVVNDELLM